MAGTSGDFVKVHKNIINILLNIPDRQHIFFLILLRTVINSYESEGLLLKYLFIVRQDLIVV